MEVCDAVPFGKCSSLRGSFDYTKYCRLEKGRKIYYYFALKIAIK